MFYDHLNKANVFLENIIDLADEKLDSRIVNDLISEPVEGQYRRLARCRTFNPADVFSFVISLYMQTGVNGSSP